MRFIQTEDKASWNEFINNSPNADLLQTWEWGEVKRIEGWVPYRFILETQGNITIAAQLLLKNTPFFGTLAYIPYGPVLGDPDKFNESEWQLFVQGIVDFCKNNNTFILEIEPKFHEQESVLKKLANFKIVGRNRQPKHKLVINLSQTDEEILAGMKKNTRYNINYAQRHGVLVNKYSAREVCEKPELLDKFYELVLDMQQRTKGYPVRSKNYFKKLFEEYKDTSMLMLIEAVFEDDVIAMNISEFTNTWASSFYAGSNRLHPNVKAPYLLRWESIKEAKNRGCKVYDFWGIVPDSKHHKGYSDHKLSFGGDRIDFVGILTYGLNTKANVWEIALKLQKLMVKLKYS